MSPRTVGIEEELFVVPTGRAALAPSGEAVVAAAKESSDGDQFEHELKQEQVELGTRPCEELTDLERDVVAMRGELDRAARERGLRLVASGTAPFATRSHLTPAARYLRMADEFGDVARSQLTCGMHVHVGVASAEEGVAVLDRIRPWLAPLVALSSSSPFCDGRDTGYASYRRVLWGRWPTAGETDVWGSLDSYRATTEKLIATGAALDEGMLYYDARLSRQYPTVEIRVCDVCIDPYDGVLLGGLIRALVDTAADEWAAGVPPAAVPVAVLRAAGWRSARHGMADRLVRFAADGSAQLRPAWTVVDELVAHVSPALDRAGDADRVREGLDRIRSRGTGAEVQRAAFERAGTMQAVVDATTIGEVET
ncbi:MAG TPA: glutamate--cysteine ligase [Mycobacteriales bacterium]|nr:glutamate--cysteine ligase [Mycobacteriales bacterium]